MVSSLVAALQALPPEAISGLMLLTSVAGILVFFRLFGLYGLYAFLGVAVLCSNIQVLKIIPFNFFPEPLAAGTIVFSTTYLCLDIITEHYGAFAAHRAIWLSFAISLLFTLFMVLTLGWSPLIGPEALLESGRFMTAHQAMVTLFMPAPALFLASMIAYLCSQYYDVWVFTRLQKLPLFQKSPGIRSAISTSLASLLDNIIFSVLAWKVFASEPMDTHTLIFTYILGTYVLRMIIGFLTSPFVALSYYFAPNRQLKTDEPLSAVSF